MAGSDPEAFAALGRVVPAANALGAIRLPPGEPDVHVWRIPLHPGEDQSTGLVELLSADERSRMASFHKDADRRRFACARGTLRLLLGHYLQRDPRDLIFAVGRHGKPRLASPPTLEFNLTHSGELALIALCTHRAVGVDVESLARGTFEVQPLARRVLSAPEQEWLARIDDLSRAHAFLQLWACKEAISKAAGEGFAAGFARIQTDPEQLSPARPQVVEAAGSRWRLHVLAPGDGYVGALAVAAPPADAG